MNVVVWCALFGASLFLSMGTHREHKKHHHSSHKHSSKRHHKSKSKHHHKGHHHHHHHHHHKKSHHNKSNELIELKLEDKVLQNALDCLEAGVLIKGDGDAEAAGGSLTNVATTGNSGSSDSDSSSDSCEEDAGVGESGGGKDASKVVVSKESVQEEGGVGHQGAAGEVNIGVSDVGVSADVGRDAVSGGSKEGADAATASTGSVTAAKTLLGQRKSIKIQIGRNSEEAAAGTSDGSAKNDKGGKREVLASTGSKSGTETDRGKMSRSSYDPRSSSHSTSHRHNSHPYPSFRRHRSRSSSRRRRPRSRHRSRSGSRRHRSRSRDSHRHHSTQRRNRYSKGSDKHSSRSRSRGRHSRSRSRGRRSRSRSKTPVNPYRVIDSIPNIAKDFSNVVKQTTISKFTDFCKDLQQRQEIENAGGPVQQETVQYRTPYIMNPTTAYHPSMVGGAVDYIYYNKTWMTTEQYTLTTGLLPNKGSALAPLRHAALPQPEMPTTTTTAAAATTITGGNNVAAAAPPAQIIAAPPPPVRPQTLTERFPVSTGLQHSSSSSSSSSGGGTVGGDVFKGKQVYTTSTVGVA